MIAVLLCFSLSFAAFYGKSSCYFIADVYVTDLSGFPPVISEHTP